MATNDPGPASERRAALIALLEERARLLAPSAEVVGRALRRCVRHDLRAQKRGSPVVSALPALVGDEPAGSPQFTVAVGLPAVALPGDNEPAAADSLPAGGIATEVAKAHTVSEDEPQPPTPISVAPAPPAIGPGADSGSRRSTRTLESGRQLGGYRIEEMIGAGGMGQVYRATQLSMNRQVALKVLAPRLTRNARFRERFLREARAAGRLHHPNLISVHDVNEAEGLLYFSMELVEGTSIKDLIAELGTIDEERALDIVRQTLEALRYAHERGIVHRDIKPDNLMLTRTGTVKVADLGLSRSDNPDDDGDEFTTKTGTMMGTPYYMPPEQGRDAHRADHRADIYATGATLFHMVCGRVPFDGDTAVAILINASTQPLVFSEPGPTPPVRRLLAALMARKIADRPQSASDALAMLKHLRTGPLAVAAPGERAAGPSGRMRPSLRTRSARRRKPLVRTVLVMLALAAIGGAVWWLVAIRPLRDLRLRCAAFASEHRYAVALGEVEHARGGEVRDGAALDRLHVDLTAAWDTWAGALAQPVFAACDAALAAGRPADADRALDAVEEAWRSPLVRQQLDAREQALDQARARAAAPEDRSQGLQRRVDAWLGQALAGKAEIRDGAARLAGTGAAPLPAFTVRERPLALPLELAVRFPADADADDRVQIVVGGHAVRFTREGAALVGGGTTRPLAGRDASGRIVVVLIRRGEVVEVATREGYPSALPLGSGGQAVLTWEVGKGRSIEFAALAIGRRREAPPGNAIPR